MLQKNNCYVMFFIDCIKKFDSEIREEMSASLPLTSIRSYFSQILLLQRLENVTDILYRGMRLNSFFDLQLDLQVLETKN